MSEEEKRKAGGEPHDDGRMSNPQQLVAAAAGALFVIGFVQVILTAIRLMVERDYNISPVVYVNDLMILGLFTGPALAMGKVWAPWVARFVLALAGFGATWKTMSIYEELGEVMDVWTEPHAMVMLLLFAFLAIGATGLLVSLFVPTVVREFGFASRPREGEQG